MVPWQRGKILVWDATCSDTFAASHREIAVREPGAVAAAAEHSKRSKYSNLEATHWGFRAKRSTTLALLRVTNDWLQSLDSGMEVCATFFDIRKAFDTVPHRNLISKLKSLHLHPAITRWICNYLTGRYQSSC